MVDVSSVTYWYCGKCGGEYNTQAEAEDCCKKVGEPEEEDN